MNFSRYFLLFAAVVLVVCAQQSDAGFISNVIEAGLDKIEEALDIGASQRARDTITIIKDSCVDSESATSRVRTLFINGTKYISDAENKIKNEIEKAKQLVQDDPEAAKQNVLKALDDAKNLAFLSGGSFFSAFGGALECSNNEIEQDFENGIEDIIEAGFSILDSISGIQSFLGETSDLDSDSFEILLKAAEKSADGGFAGAFANIQKSSKTTCEKFTENPQILPIEEPVENECNAAANDPVASDAVNAINKAANNALQRGASDDLVEKFREILLCALSEFVNVADGSEELVENVKKIAEINALAAKEVFSRQAESDRERIIKLVAKVYGFIGYPTFSLYNQLNSETEAAIDAIERAKVLLISGIKTSGNLIDSGLRYEGDAAQLEIEASGQVSNFAKHYFIGKVKQAALAILNML